MLNLHIVHTPEFIYLDTVCYSFFTSETFCNSLCVWWHCVCRMAFRCCRSPHSLRWRFNICGTGQLETPQYNSALQGARNVIGLYTTIHYTLVVSTTKNIIYKAYFFYLTSFYKIMFYFQSFLTSQVPDGATVALVPRHSKHIHHDNHDYVAGESEYTQDFTVTAWQEPVNFFMNTSVRAAVLLPAVNDKAQKSSNWIEISSVFFSSQFEKRTTIRQKKDFGCKLPRPQSAGYFTLMFDPYVFQPGFPLLK